MTTRESLLPLLMTAICVTLSYPGFAQKLPDSQESGFRAPAGVKIDGKPTEWNTLQAFSKSTEISYTVANDDSTLYLVVQSKMTAITNKIMRGGITFTVNANGKKKEKEGVAITFPFIVPTAPRVVTGSPGGGTRQVMSVSSGMAIGGGAPGGDAAAMKKRRDSLAYVNNNKQIEKFKDIRIEGIPAITDSLLSIYNEEGIKARCTYEEQGTFTYELAVPLKYLSLSIKDPKEFLYNVKLNGINLGGGISFGGGTIVVNGGGGGGATDFQAMFSPTDFWGKYMLVKK